MDHRQQVDVIRPEKESGCSSFPADAMKWSSPPLFVIITLVILHFLNGVAGDFFFFSLKH